MAERKIPDDPEAEGWEYVECWFCGGSGEVEHDCGEDACCCLYPEPDACPECRGEGGVYWAPAEETPTPSRAERGEGR